MLRTAFLILACAAFASCSTLAPTAPEASAAVRDDSLRQISAECLAAKLVAPASMPVGMIPDGVLRKAQSGSVSVRYDVVSGKARNAVVVASSPPGLYDAYVLRHVDAYTEPTGATVRGCVMTTDIKF